MLRQRLLHNRHDRGPPGQPREPESSTLQGSNDSSACDDAGRADNVAGWTASRRRARTRSATARAYTCTRLDFTLHTGSSTVQVSRSTLHRGHRRHPAPLEGGAASTGFVLLHRRQVAAEAAEQRVVAAAATERGAQRRVVDLEDRAGVVAQDRARPRSKRTRPATGPGSSACRPAGRSRSPRGRRAPPGRRASAAGREGTRAHRPQPKAGDLPLEPDEVARDQLVQQRPRASVETPKRRAAPGRARRPDADAVVVSPAASSAAPHGDRLGRALRRRGAHELDAGLQELPRLAALGADPR